MPQLTNPPSMTKERESWKPTDADGPGTKPEKPGTPTTDKLDLPDGLDSSGMMTPSIEAFSIHLQLHARNSTEACQFTKPQMNASC